MKIYEFTLNIDGSPILTDEDLAAVSSAFYENVDDGFVCSVDEAMYIEFVRQSESLEVAITSAIKEVESLKGYCLTVSSVDGDYVSLGEAAELTGVKKSTLTKYKKGNFGGGGFPAPARKAARKDPLWRLLDVALWLYSKGKTSEEVFNRAKVISTINAILDNRNLSRYTLYKRISTMI